MSRNFGVKGIDTSTCIDKGDLVDLIISSFNDSASDVVSNACEGVDDLTTRFGTPGGGMEENPLRS